MTKPALPLLTLLLCADATALDSDYYRLLRTKDGAVRQALEQLAAGLPTRLASEEERELASVLLVAFFTGSARRNSLICDWRKGGRLPLKARQIPLARACETIARSAVRSTCWRASALSHHPEGFALPFARNGEPMQNIKRQYSNTFEIVDPEGEFQVATEEAISFRLFDAYTQYSLFEQALWIVQRVCETFTQHLEGLSIATALAAADAVQSYLLDWQASLAEARGPDVDDAGQAGKDLLLVALGHLLPACVEEVPNAGTTDALVDEDQFWEDVRGMLERADRSDRLLRYRVETDAEGPYYTARPRRALSTYLLLVQTGTQGVRLFVEVLMPGTLVVIDDDCLIGAPA